MNPLNWQGSQVNGKKYKSSQNFHLWQTRSTEAFKKKKKENVEKKFKLKTLVLQTPGRGSEKDCVGVACVLYVCVCVCVCEAYCKRACVAAWLLVFPSDFASPFQKGVLLEFKFWKGEAIGSSAVASSYCIPDGWRVVCERNGICLFVYFAILLLASSVSKQQLLCCSANNSELPLQSLQSVALQCVRPAFIVSDHTLWNLRRGS
jgi:hypothetical protein